jgi:hypothetical protein
MRQARTRYVLAIASVLALLPHVAAGRLTLPSLITALKDHPDYLTAPHQRTGLQAGYFYQPYLDRYHQWRVQTVPYIPEPGDLLLFDDHNQIVTFFYQLVGSGPPLHAAMVIQRPEGSPALLEAGPNFIPRVFIMEPLPRIRAYNGTVLIRKPKRKLTAEQSAALTRFAYAQEGKDYALARLFLQGTPFRCRVGLRKMWFAHTRLNRNRWTCSELTIAAGVAAGILDSRRFPANAMYPQDMCYDERYDLSGAYYEPVLWTEFPTPADLVPDSQSPGRFTLQTRNASQ